MTRSRKSEVQEPMRCDDRTSIRRSVLGAVALLVVLIQMTGAAVASNWVERESAKFRFLANTTTTGTSGEVLIGLEIDLEPGWQFYSEVPGEFGVAPVFDRTASHNLAEASIFWPDAAQILYSVDPPVSSLGYKGSVLLPVVLEVGELGADLSVRLDLEYAVCEEICIFGSVGLRLTLPAGRGEAARHSERIQQALTDAKTRLE